MLSAVECCSVNIMKCTCSRLLSYYKSWTQHGIRSRATVSDWSHPGYQPTVSANMVIKRFNRKVQLVEKEGWHAAELQVGFTLSKLKKNRRFLFWQVEVWKRDGWTMWTKNNNKVFSTTVTENVKYWFSLLLENTTAKHKNENWSKGLTQDTNDSTSIKIWISPFKTLSGDLKHLIKTCLQSI